MNLPSTVHPLPHFIGRHLSNTELEKLPIIWTFEIGYIAN